MFQGFLTWEFILSSSVYYIKFWIKKPSLQKKSILEISNLTDF
ncbi:hypothetical protein LEP1GSC132_2038 [Leptospira kirschneri str. 200803703]|uniref:Uncharacterized protein n=1 Tax=Leptospira kirschneri str. 200802841 TaxID=1193047 RepID=A0A828XY95_9LEPT|nr:hypothetical protein LEP1GSC044_3545 [Leptospira kirschneri serovar Grippotyphosa str. RM52]EKO52223.1 hypothetical protein LEP1GSC131_3626 [Leptospira kirschneri str. 200802841]EKP06218.1 hypothetical protein LEP1GSC018_1772 [Leptospira kirschneri str. 2008720114]EKQ85148.1 hypothetical protein LEP1GSC064_1607 [Leptospira kirschneri serovar Grippotyphosa str. Moskva]EKR06745.1 hypothetical protein LEP1GSC122_0973 [Leptospira kirschneri serovar Valbuzzi str. 200702274]EMK02368.1 hypothetica